MKMMKKTKICPSRILFTLENATNARFAAFSINSMDMNMISALRRMSTPKAPIVNRTAESTT